ncbi:2'-5' RNA ligase family protein [Chitinophaga rhizosphaerae]|uniref:2'-5' RNA ligase family protein n=1 Tax=Chitinophaga rhizosphaerae TaxID=1864947 RepID=UPI000F809C81|nr:2'-5' RNA ligase family protein [Chitinophaga rhizosphaerae]
MEQEVLHDYMLVVHPDAQTVQDVSMYKHLIAEELGSAPGSFTQAHIALFRSEFPERYEQVFVTMLEGLVANQSAFTVYTSRIDHARQSNGRHMFYVNVANPKPLEDLHKKVLTAFELEPASYRPHIALARSLQPHQFTQLSPYLSGKVFVRSFHCHSFSLMKRAAGSDRYELVREFTFGKEVPSSNPLFHRAA